MSDWLRHLFGRRCKRLADHGHVSDVWGACVMPEAYGSATICRKPRRCHP